MSAPMVVHLDVARVDAIFAKVNQCHLPGAAVGIAIRGRPVYRKGFGLASMELPLVLSPTIRMRIASMTKHFTCLAYMLLAEEGLVEGLDDRIERFLPEIHQANHGVTIRQLMGHISGLRDACDLCYQFSGTGRAVSITDLLSMYREIDDVNYPPGTTWNYNNGGYLMLSVAIERVAGCSLDQFLEEKVFGPIGMYETRMRRVDSDFLPNSAALHMTTMTAGFEKSYLGTEDSGVGGLVSNVNDMLRWMAHMDDPWVGSAATWKTITEPLSLANGMSTGYALGLIRGGYRGVETLSHSGWNMGCNSHMVKVPAAGLDVVILANTHEGIAPALALEVLDGCLPDLAPKKTVEHATSAEGLFRSPRTDRVIELFERNGRQIASIDGWDWEFTRSTPTVLEPIPTLSFFKLRILLEDGAAARDSIEYEEFGAADRLVALPINRSADASSIVGEYESSNLRIRLEILRSPQGVRVRARGAFGVTEYTLNSLSDAIWRAKSLDPMPWGGILLFKADCSGFKLTTGRNVGLVFRRMG